VPSNIRRGAIMTTTKSVVKNDKFSNAFTTSNITNIGIKRERLKDWMERGFVEPSIQKAEGQGTKNLFSIFDLYTIMLFKTLIKYGFSRQDAGFRIKWVFYTLIRGNEEDFWGNTLFLGFVRIAAEQDPIIKRLFHSGIKSAKALAKIVDNLPQREHDIMFGSFVPLPFDETSKNTLSRCTRKSISFHRDIGNDCDAITIINLSKIREQVDNLI
jgi:hypothetical protein